MLSVHERFLRVVARAPMPTPAPPDYRWRTGWHPSVRHVCPAGHWYDEANTYVDPDGKRHCRTCGREGKQRLRVQRRAWRRNTARYRARRRVTTPPDMVIA